MELVATVSQKLTIRNIGNAIAAATLDVMGVVQEDGTTLLLLGPASGFWEMFKNTPEMQDGKADPIDRWSLRVIKDLADKLQAEPLFPFGGPPYQPFLRWALASGRAWQSPAGMLVHDTAGLMISYRGVLRFDTELDWPANQSISPCLSCADQPCATACPVNALSAKDGYNVDACHSYLDTPAGQGCMTYGCIARRACPVSQTFNRNPEQSALHMSYFHKS